MNITFLKQKSPNECGIACIRMLCVYYKIDMLELEKKTKRVIGINGIYLQSIIQILLDLGFRCIPLKGNFSELMYYKNSLPCIALWQNKHFILITEFDEQYVQIADPAVGIKKILSDEFMQSWYLRDQEQGIILICKPIFHKLEYVLY